MSLLICAMLVFISGTVAAEAATVKVSAPSKVTATTTYDTVKLSWAKVSKATGYKVYKKTDGKWKAIKTVTSNTYTAKDLTASESYSFAVKTYRKVYTAFADAGIFRIYGVGRGGIHKSKIFVVEKGCIQRVRILCAVYYLNIIAKLGKALESFFYHT